jgi:hypothetical protein
MTTVPLGPGSGIGNAYQITQCQSMNVWQDGRALAVEFRLENGEVFASVRLVGTDAEGLFAAALEEGWEVFRRAVDALEVCNTIAQQGWKADAELPDGRTLGQVVEGVTGGVVNG